jgi:hypothetical protein
MMGSFHAHIGELGRLAAYIALILKNPATTELGHVRGYLNTLDQWHRTLPPPMQLSRLNLADPLAETDHTKRALLQLHILFLGLFIEPFRTCLVDIGNIRLGNITASRQDVEIMEQIEGQTIEAARQSSRIVGLLQVNQLIRSQCWVVV